MQAPQCPRCGGIVTNPGATQCQFCGSPLAQLVAPYGAAPIPPQGGYAPLPPQQQGYVPPPQQAYGAPPPAMPSYGQPQQPYGYGAPQPGYPPNPYAGYGQGPQVQGWGGRGYIAPAQQGVFGGSAWNNTWNIINIIRLSIAVLVLGGFMFAGCISALSH
jgi:hypothetical protein